MECVNINGSWRAVRGVWVNVGGVWKPSFGNHCNIGGVWKGGKTHFYSYGTENYAWAQGYSAREGSYAKNADNLYMKCNPNMVGGDAFYRNWVTNGAVSLANFKKLYFRGKVTTNGHVVDWGICTAADKMNAAFTKKVRATDLSAWDGTSSIDISDFSGMYHVKVQAYDGSIRGTNCYIYEIWAQ